MFKTVLGRSQPSKNKKKTVVKFQHVKDGSIPQAPVTPIASLGRSTGGLESCPHGVHQSHAVTWAPRKIAMFTRQET